jgi:hypothetical protein
MLMISVVLARTGMEGFEKFKEGHIRFVYSWCNDALRTVTLYEGD